MVDRAAEGIWEPWFLAQEPFENPALFKPAVVAIGGLVDEEDAGGVDRITDRGFDTEETAEVLVIGGGQGLAEVTDDGGLLEFDTDSWMTGSPVNGPDSA